MTGSLNLLLSPARFEWALDSRRKRMIFVLAFVILGAMLALKAAQVALASVWGASGNLPELRKALAVDPGDSDVRHKLGLVCLYRFEGSLPQEGLEHLREATDLAPNRGSYWEDLGLACESAGYVPCAQAAIGRTLQLDPMRPRAHWLAANYYVHARQTSQGLQELRRLLELDPAYAESIFELCLRLRFKAETVDQQVLPEAEKPAVQLIYAEFLAARGEVTSAARVWDEALASKRRFSFPQAEPYVNRLIQGGQYSQAFQSWQDLERLGVVEKPDHPNESVFNGGFEHLPANAGFDWRCDKPPYVTLNFDDPGGHEGRRCLRFDFTVPRNEEYEPVYEIVQVAPNQAYLLTAWTRSEGLTSDSGPRVRVVDAVRPEDLVATTESTVGTTPWHAVHVTFTSPPCTQFVRLSIWRPRSRSFPSEIQGAFWIDAVSLKPVPPRPSVRL
jgi:tetratricopeptide (TPR) repeat protein